jgi:hypothetical protein
MAGEVGAGAHLPLNGDPSYLRALRVLRAPHPSKMPFSYPRLCGRWRPTPRRRAALPPAPPSGAVSLPPNPLEIEVLFHTDDHSVMPLLAPAAEQLLSISAESLPHSAALGMSW